MTNLPDPTDYAIVAEVLQERHRQQTRWGEQDHTIAREHGRLISQYGHRFQFLGYWHRPSDNRLINLWAFPSKVTINVNSDLDTIEDSLTALVNVAAAFPSLQWGLPRPGSNLGGLDWYKDVKELVSMYVTSSPNITVYHYAQSGVPRDKADIQA